MIHFASSLLLLIGLTLVPRARGDAYCCPVSEYESQGCGNIDLEGCMSAYDLVMDYTCTGGYDCGKGYCCTEDSGNGNVCRNKKNRCEDKSTWINSVTYVADICRQEYGGTICDGSEEVTTSRCCLSIYGDCSGCYTFREFYFWWRDSGIPCGDHGDYQCFPDYNAGFDSFECPKNDQQMERAENCEQWRDWPLEEFYYWCSSENEFFPYLETC